MPEDHAFDQTQSSLPYRSKGRPKGTRSSLWLYLVIRGFVICILLVPLAIVSAVGWFIFAYGARSSGDWVFILFAVIAPLALLDFAISGVRSLVKLLANGDEPPSPFD